MDLASESSPLCDSSVSQAGRGVNRSKSGAVAARLRVQAMLCEPRPMPQSVIAVACGVSRQTVSVYARELRERGVDWLTDRRKSNGRVTTFERAYARIRELKAENPRSGGRDLWVMLVHDEGFDPSDVPSIGRIDGWLSENRLVHPHRRVDKHSGFWATERVCTFLDRVGMDEVFPFHVGNGRRMKVVDLRDNFSGAVYGEPFPMDFDKQDGRGLDQLAFSLVFGRFVEHMGAPKVLVLDNGGGQVIQDGWLPEVARNAINCGTVVDWEPYGCPTVNAHVERWHRELQKRFGNAKRTLQTYAQAAEWVRRECWRETSIYPRKQCKNLPPSKAFAIRPWAQDLAIPDDAERIGHGNSIQVGTVRMHRRVESKGMVQLHGEEYIRVSDMLCGSKVRIDFVVYPGGQCGEGSVVDNHGQVACTFRHRIEVGVKSGERLVFDVKQACYAGGEDVRSGLFSQDMYDDDMRRMHKNDRSKGFLNARAREMESDLAYEGEVSNG